MIGLSLFNRGVTVAPSVALALSGGAAFPINLWLIGHGRGHALAHKHHGRD